VPRVARGLTDGAVYHVLNRGNGRQQIFHKAEDFIAFIELLGMAKDRYPVNILSYCLMPNHFHLILKAQQGEELSRFMQWIMTSHVRRYHRHYRTSGHVWQGRFKSFLIQEDNHLLTVIRYIEGNPVRAGMVRTAREWAWSSHAESCARRQREITTTLPVDLPENWEGYVDAPLTQVEQAKCQQSVDRQAPFGSEDWQLKIARLLGLESTLRPRGRPAKKLKK